MTDMKRDKKSKIGWLRTAFLLVLVVLLLKLGLTLGSAVFMGRLQLTASEVIAGDKKEKSQEAPAPKNAQTSAKDPSTAKETPPATTPAKTAKAAANPSVAESIAFLQQKETELNKREEVVREKEERLNKMEKDVEQKLKDLIGIQKEIQSYRNEKAEGRNVKVRSLAKIYGTMKAKEAAKLMENLDEKLVMNIISTMSSEEAASIMSNMDVKKAAKISEAMSGK